MAWWTHLLFFSRYLGERNIESEEKGLSPLAVLRRALKSYIYNNLVDLLYFALSIFTYVYLGLSIVAFFFEKKVPEALPEIIDTLSEPYLGSLGIYVIVKEIERRRGRIKQNRWGELFAVIWFLFFLVASTLTYFSDQYHVSIVYKTVVTNALAAIIIRVGTLLR